MFRGGSSSIAAGLVAHAQVIQALVLREIRTRFGHYRLGYPWALAEPVAHVAVLSIIFGLRSPTVAGNVDFPLFLATGIIPYLLFHRMVMRGMSTVEGNRALFSYRQVKPIDTLIARAILEVVIYGAVFVVFMTGAAWLGFDVAVHDPLPVLMVFLLLALLGLGLGSLACVAATMFTDTTQVVPIVLRPLYFISGIFFSVERLPAEYRDYLLWNPVLHALELIREHYFREIDASFGDPLYLGWTTAVSVALGLLTFHVYRYRMVAT